MPPVTQSEELAFGVLAVLAVAAISLLALQRPPVTRRRVLAALPWLVTGAALAALTSVTGYPPMLRPIMRVPWAYVFTASLATLVWTLIEQFAVSPKSSRLAAYYFGLTGVGFLLPAAVVLVVVGGVRAPQTFVAWMAVPVVAVIATYLTLLALGLWLPTPTYFAGVAGAFLVFGGMLDGVTTAVAVALGAATPSALVLDVAARLASTGWLSHALSVALATIWLRLAVVILAVAALAAVERAHPRLAERGLDLATLVVVVAAASHFLAVFVGGGVA